MRRRLFWLGLWLVGCAHTPPCALVGDQRPFGACCVSDPECGSSRCFEFGDHTRRCTRACDRDDACPSGSRGTKCNKKGVCRP